MCQLSLSSPSFPLLILAHHSENANGTISLKAQPWGWPIVQHIPRTFQYHQQPQHGTIIPRTRLLGVSEMTLWFFFQNPAKPGKTLCVRCKATFFPHSMFLDVWDAILVSIYNLAFFSPPRMNISVGNWRSNGLHPWSRIRQQLHTYSVFSIDAKHSQFVISFLLLDLLIINRSTSFLFQEKNSREYF